MKTNRSSLKDFFTRHLLHPPPPKPPIQSPKGKFKPIPKSTPLPPPKGKKKRKATIPAAFREQIWIRDCGKTFEAKCPTPWCQNRITVFDFQSGHNIPESKGGPTKPENLLPLCSRCNQSMGDRYTFDEWSLLAAPAADKATTTNPSQPPPLTVEEAPKPSRWCC
jgi:hypothetical protein